MPEPFDANEVIRVCERMRDQPTFQDWGNVIGNRYKLLHGEMGVDIPGIAHKLEDRSAALRFHRTQYNNRIHAAELRQNVSARSTEETAIKAAQRVENWNYALSDHFTRPIGENADRASIDQQVSYGCGIRHIEFAPTIREMIFGKSVGTVEELRAALPQAGFTEIPFVLRCPALSATFWEPDRSGFCEIGEQKISDLQSVYEDDKELWKWLTSSTMPESGEASGAGEYQDTAKIYHLETSQYIYDVLGARGEGQMLDFRVNVAERPWYTLIPGHENSEIVVAKRYEPLIGPLYEVVQVGNILGTLVMSGGFQTGRNTLQLVKDSKSGADNYSAWLNMPASERPVLHSPTGESAVETPPDGYHYEPMPIPDQEQLLNAYQMNEERLQRWGFPTALATDAPIQAEATSGYHAARQMEAASDFLEPALRNRASAIREEFGLIADIIQALNLPITIPVHLKAEGRADSREVQKIKPEDFREYDQEVSFESVPASVKMAIEQADQAKVLAGLMPHSTAMAHIYDNPLEEQKKIDLEQVRQPVKEMTLQAVLALVQQSLPGIVEAAAAEAGVPIPPAQPPPPGGPPPGQDIRSPPMPPVPMPGAGDELVPVEQRPPGEAAIPSQGIETQVVVP